MALSTPSESPAVVVKEIDLTGGVPNVQSTTGATDSATTFSFHRANFFLKYSNSLQTVRVIDSTAKNAVSTTGQTDASSPTAEVVKNTDDFNSQLSSLDTNLQTFVARYPGALGN